MRIFKDIMNIVNTTLSAGMFGAAITQTFIGNYKTSTILLFIVASLFIVSYFAERFSD